MATVAIIGAGMAGAAAGQALQRAGVGVRLFDKGRGAGGRLSVRRVSTPAGDAAFDHGAQWFTGRDPGFAAAVRGWAEVSACATWAGRLVRVERDRTTPLDPEDRWVGVGGMSAVAKAALAGLDVRFGARVSAIDGAPGAWTLRLEDGGAEGPFATVLCAVPAEQAGPMLAGVAPLLAAEAYAARTAPCWTALAVFDRPLDAGFDGATMSGPLAWAAREAGKPGKPSTEAWTLQASPDWSRDHLEDPAESVAAALVDAFGAVVDAPPPVWSQAHRWRFARVARAIGTPFGWDPAARIGTAGDWRLGPRVEAAWLSGDGLGRGAAASLS